MKKLLFIGAGFSYDLGMPLAHNLTRDFFSFLTPEKTKNFIEMWKSHDPYGEGRPLDKEIFDEVYDIYIKFYQDDNCNYEEFLKEIQNLGKMVVDQPKRDSLHYAFSKFYDIITYMLWIYQKFNFSIFDSNMNYYKKFSEYVPDNEELWVVSLNHDLYIEMLCLEMGIPISFGSDNKLNIPIDNYNLNNTLSFELIKREDLNLNKMNFIQNSRGINLLKLHGALNEFTYNDDKNLLHVSLEDCSTAKEYLNKNYKVHHDLKYYINGTLANMSNEIIVSDENGIMQFLRSSIKMGGDKYSIKFDLKPGEEKLYLFEEILKQVEEITIIGYSFSDKHVNLRLYNAMLLNPHLKIHIIDPFNTKTPAILEPFDYKLRIRKGTCGTPEWFSFLANGKWDNDLSKNIKEFRNIRPKYDLLFQKQYFKTRN
ncbi:hypothetical protein [Rummeliibacillus pycnus]|uniref:hypothetical protein n=1 Tax=Rummeliibacillus pycnus TaxID=101070 RepID=UPI0037C5312E